MKSLAQTVSMLHATHYLQAQLTQNGELLASKLLPNGERLRAELACHWWRTCFAGIKNQINLAEAQQADVKFNERVEFFKSTVFIQQLVALRQHNSLQEKQQQQFSSQIPAVIRFAQQVEVLPNVKQTQLVCLYLCHPSTALEQYYKLQRERKIWWMRISFNPSRYYLEPYVLQQEHCQSITIKSRLSFSNMPVEHVSIVPLHKMTLPHEGRDYILEDERSSNNKKNILPTVLRTVTDLSLATYALLLDGCDHSRHHTLMLHRRLVPYQCAIAAYASTKSVKEVEVLQKLCAHISKVLQHAGLRCYNSDWDPLHSDWDYLIEGKKQLRQQLNKADCLGIPYVLLVNEETLNTGFLELRSRDTSLAETIHISDITTYLPNIFTH